MTAPAESPPTEGSDRRSGRPLLFVVAAVLVGLAGVGVVLLSRPAAAPDGVRVASARAGESTGQAAAVYLDLTARGGDDTLVGASSPAAARVSLHEAEVDGGLTLMAITDAIPLPEGEATELAPGGSHLMLEALTGPLLPGDRIEVTLDFARSADLTVEVPVVGLADLLETR